jgi:hypothetical protein
MKRQLSVSCFGSSWLTQSSLLRFWKRNFLRAFWSAHRRRPIRWRDGAAGFACPRPRKMSFNASVPCRQISSLPQLRHALCAQMEERKEAAMVWRRQTEEAQRWPHTWSVTGSCLRIKHFSNLACQALNCERFSGRWTKSGEAIKQVLPPISLNHLRANSS